MHSKKKHYYLSFIIVLFLFVTLNFIILVTSSSAQEEDQLIIYLYDISDDNNIPLETPYIFTEGKEYSVAVFYRDIAGIAYDVTVEVPWESSKTSSETPEIPIHAPDYEDYTNGFLITASKEGYASDEVEVILTKGRLYITTGESITEENSVFTVIVTNENDEPIGDVTITTEDNQIFNTNLQGKAEITAQEVSDNKEITVSAYKEGYTSGSTKVMIENINNQIFPEIAIDPLYIAIALVIIAIIYVALRQKFSRTKGPREPKHQIYKQPKESSQKKYIDKSLTPEVKIKGKTTSAVQSKHTELPIKNKGSKVEEIRIQRPAKKKETQYVASKNKTERKKPRRSNNHDYDWFEGTDGIRYKIDRITGEIDEETVDKWFEGVDDIRLKIDETLSKKHKKDKK